MHHILSLRAFNFPFIHRKLVMKLRKYPCHFDHVMICFGHHPSIDIDIEPRTALRTSFAPRHYSCDGCVWMFACRLYANGATTTFSNLMHVAMSAFEQNTAVTPHTTFCLFAHNKIINDGSWYQLSTNDIGHSPILELWPWRIRHECVACNIKRRNEYVYRLVQSSCLLLELWLG